MAYRYGDRCQGNLFPKTIEEFVAEDAPVRVYNLFVDAIGIEALGIKWDSNHVGNSAYDPRSMLKLLIYGYSYGIRSSRKLERACNDNVSFMWLMGGLMPDHKTISEFRRNNLAALKKVLGQCARLCVKLDLIEGNVLFVDGSRLRANASIGNSYTTEKGLKAIDDIDKRIEKLLADCEAADREEEGMKSLSHVREELADKKALRGRIEAALDEISRENRSSFNTTDPDCVRVHSRQGSYAGYNAQITVDDKNGLIVVGDVVDKNNDFGQFGSQILEAQKVIEIPCEKAVADAGYANYEDISRLEREGIDIIMPSQKQAQEHEKEEGPFAKSRFHYDEENDVYICPLGHRLRYISHEKKRKLRSYLGGTVCRSCAHFGTCTNNRVYGRKVVRSDYEKIRRRIEKRYEDPDAKEVFRRRKMRAEHPFGHIKRNLGVRHFLLRGLAGVRAEWSLLASAFNLTRMINILGVRSLIAGLSG